MLVFLFMLYSVCKKSPSPSTNIRLFDRLQTFKRAVALDLRYTCVLFCVVCPLSQKRSFVRNVCGDPDFVPAHFKGKKNIKPTVIWSFIAEWQAETWIFVSFYLWLPTPKFDFKETEQNNETLGFMVWRSFQHGTTR